MSDREKGGEAAGTAVVRKADGQFDMAAVTNPAASLEVAERLLGAMADRCKGPAYIANIQNKRYPKVEWWTTVGAALGLFPREEETRKLEREGETAYEATVGVYNGTQLVTRASAMCSSAEPRWRNSDEYAIRSMATTRATGKAYRLGLSFLAVMSGLEATPAEEMPYDEPVGSPEPEGPACPECGSEMWDNRAKKASGAYKPNAPDFKCKAKGCDGAIWNYEAHAAHEDADDALKAARARLASRLREYQPDDEIRKKIAEALVVIQAEAGNVPADPVEFLPEDFDRLTKLVDKQTIAECYEFMETGELPEQQKAAP